MGWWGFVWPFMVAWVLTYGITSSLLLAPFRVRLAVRAWGWVSRPAVRGLWDRERRLLTVRNRGRRAIYWLSAMYCPVCVGTWVLGGLGAFTTYELGSWTTREFLAWWATSVVAFIVATAKGYMPTAEDEASRSLGIIRSGTNEIVQGEIVEA